MPGPLRQTVRDHLNKCHEAAIAAVESYNRPGRRFRTAQYLVIITIAWTSLFHAIYFRRNRRPWYRKKGHATGRGIRYQKVDGEPKYWDLTTCVKEYFGSTHPAERKNLEFIIGLRNKIEHRHLPELDATLYGECQAALLNLEALLVKEFGGKYALQDSLAVSLQFSRVTPPEKRQAAKTLATTTSKTVVEYIEQFRGSLASSDLNSMRYSFSVFLIPQVANRKSSADAAVQFLDVNEASSEELERIEKLNVLIREKKIPIVNLDLFKPSSVVAEVQASIPWRFSFNAHADAWKHYGVRPASRSANPERTMKQYCVYDRLNRDYLYTKAWIDRLVRDLKSADGFQAIVGRKPQAKN